MYRNSIPLILFIVTLSVSNAFAQKIWTAKPGTKTRKAILNSVRVPVQKELKQKIIFLVNEFKVSGRWAFVSGEPLNKNGKKPNYKGTKYEQDVKDGLFDDNFFALLKKTGKRWRVVSYEMGCTDVCYSHWSEKYKAPKSIFSLPE